jgi:PPK2 family polyphosphate:nucleotide phosphotransferase
MATMSEVLRVPAGRVDLHAIDSGATPAAGRDGRRAAERLQSKLAPRLAELQEMLYAAGRTGGKQTVLLVLQGLDTSGKSGTIRHVLGQVDPQGTRVHAFGAPTAEERRHDFLWRVRRQLPAPGYIGVFDRSHYEDVLVARVRELGPRATWSRRYDAINRFEQKVAKRGTTIIKCLLHISFGEWRERQLARLDNPKKHWKFDPRDVDDALLWNDYLAAYEDALERCDSDRAPWFVVPADHKWHRNLAVTRLLIEHLEELELDWPRANFDVDEQRRRVLAAQP